MYWESHVLYLIKKNASINASISKDTSTFPSLKENAK